MTDIKVISNIDSDILIEKLNKELIKQGWTPPPQKQKIIDLSKVGSDIDMEFSNDGQEHHFKRSIGKLLNMTPTKGIPFYSTVLNDEFYKCRIRENHWHSFKGDKCPLPEGLIISYSSMAGTRRSVNRCTNYSNLVWSLIYEFKVLGTADDARYEWEKEE